MRAISVVPRLTLPTPRQKRRTAQRLELALPVEIFDGQGIAFATATNLSSGGMFVAGDLDYGIGTQLHVRMSVAARSMVVAVEVRWVKSDGGARGLGLRFVRVKQPDLEHILEFVHEQRRVRAL